MNFNHAYINSSQPYSPEEIQSYHHNHLELNREIQSFFKDEKGEVATNNRKPVGDGIFNAEGYLKAKLKILWLMKEPYDTNKGENVNEKAVGGWYFSDSDIYTKFEFGKAYTTWFPIIEISHGILSNHLVWDQSSKITKYNKVNAQVLSHIAYANIQKLPSLSREVTNNTVVQNSFLFNKNLFEKQFRFLDPDIIVGANTLNDNVFIHFSLKGNLFKTTDTNQSYKINNKLFIRAKHPAWRGSKEKYINDILSTVNEWRRKQQVK